MAPRGLLRASGVVAVAAAALLGFRTARTDRPVEAGQQIRQLRAYEVGRVHNQCVTLPVAARVSVPRSDVSAEMRPPIHRNHASFMDHFGVQDDVARTVFSGTQPFEWRRIVIRPHSLQVLLSVRRSTHGPILVGNPPIELWRSLKQRSTGKHSGGSSDSRQRTSPRLKHTSFTPCRIEQDAPMIRESTRTRSLTQRPWRRRRTGIPMGKVMRARRMTLL